MTIKMKLVCSSLLAGIITMGLFGMMKKQEQSIKKRYQMTTVLRVTQNLSSGTELNEHNTTIESVPLQYAEPLVFKNQDELCEGKRPLYLCKISITKGQQLTKSLVTPIGEVGGLGWLIPQGKFAFTLSLSREEAVSQLLSPGDSVHVFDSHSPSTEPVVSNVQVFAVNDHFLGQVRDTKNEERTLSVESGNVYVTLLLSEIEIKRCLNSLKAGRLSLAAISFLSEQGQ